MNILTPVLAKRMLTQAMCCHILASIDIAVPCLIQNLPMDPPDARRAVFNSILDVVRSNQDGFQAAAQDIISSLDLASLELLHTRDQL